MDDPQVPLIEKTMDSSWLSNSYLVADKPGGKAVLIDTGGPPEPLLEKIEELHLTVTHVLCTHHHHDHIAHNRVYRDRFRVPVCGHRLDRELEDGEVIQCGDLEIRAMHSPGHTVGQLAFMVNGSHLFTGDTLFRGSVGGTRAPGHTTFEDLRHSVMDVLMKQPPDTVVLPGHTYATRIGEEWEKNPFILAWRGLEPVVEVLCKAFGQPATLLLEAADYDGGTKCWIRFQKNGQLDLVPGSQVNVS
ncbi:MAG: MBL fold metallo-hydrolase [Acidobacteriota bacterium]